MKRAAALALVVGSTSLVATDARSDDRPSGAELDRCHALGDGTLRSERVELERAGRLLGCSEDAVATRLFIDVERVLARVPRSLLTRRIVVELEPAPWRVPHGFAGVEADARAGAILVARERARSHPSVWLHETAHVIGAGPRPARRAARRTAAAFEEGLADYFAAAIGGDHVVGDRAGVARDLARPPRLSDAAWTMLAGASFDPHLFGHLLAALLLEAESHPGPLLEDSLVALSHADLSAADTPQQTIDALVAACPDRSRARLSKALSDWLPRELWRK